jgi:hypothetical protein
MTARSRLGSLLLSTGLLASLVAGVGTASPAAADVGACAATGNGGTAGFYPGPSASDVYDDTFAKGPAVPGLPTYTPQGLTTWSNWDGKGHTMLIVGAYRRGSASRLYGIDASTGRNVGTVKIAETHLGGLAVVGKWLITQGSETTASSEKVRTYRLSDLRAKMKAGDLPSLKAYGKTQNVYSADFMSGYGGSIWTGRYAYGVDKMYEYKVDARGRLKQVGTGWQIPPKTQGILVTGDRFFFNTWNNTRQADLWVVERGGHTLALAEGRCFRNPSMAEGIALAGGRVFSVYESGSSLYRDKATNPIAHLHTAPLSALKALDNPIVVTPEPTETPTPEPSDPPDPPDPPEPPDPPTP